jgi:hypothetical protein
VDLFTLDYYLFADGKLNITQVEKRHAGIYQCFATNELGSVYGSLMLQVLPKQVTALPTSDLPESEDTELEGMLYC